ncbi:MAG: MTH1187 family thiamine-binding protein [Candidatus Bathyarchaeia archaeon]
MDKNHLVIAEFSIIPIGQAGSSVGRYVAAAVNSLKNVKGLDFEVTPMGTILAAKDLDTIFEAVRQAHEAIIATGVKRVTSTLRIDDRRDKARTMNDKINALKEYMKEKT